MRGKLKRFFGLSTDVDSQATIRTLEERALRAENRALELDKRISELEIEKLKSVSQVYPTSLIDASLGGWFKQQTGELIEGFNITQEDQVLDVGCGDSPFIEFCANLGPDVTIVDVDAAKIAVMKAKLETGAARSVTAYVSDANPLPIASESMTKVMAMEVLEHVDDPHLFLKELVRVGKPGARYFISVPDASSELLQKKLAPDLYFEKPNHIRIITREEFASLIESAGLEIVERKFYGFYKAIWWLFFWACKQDLSPPWHPILANWDATWGSVLATEDGRKIKKALDEFMPKSQAIIARKPG